MGDRRCCCDCWVFTDTFNRDNSTALGTSWNESTGDAAGDWEILSNELHEKAGGNGTADAVLLCTVPEPDRSAGEMFITIGAKGAAEGDVFRIYPCCTDSETLGPVYVEFTVLADDEWQIDICDSGGVTETTTMQGVEVDDKIILEVCADHEHAMVLARVSSDNADPPAWDDNLDPGDGCYVAIGHDNATNGATFDNFSFGELRRGVIICHDCWCECQRTPVKRTLTLTFFDCTDRFSCWNTDTITLEWDWDAGNPKWYGEGTGDLAGITATLICDDQGKDFELYLTPTLCFVQQPMHPDLDVSTCEQLQLLYGPYIGSYLNCAACGYTVGTPMDCYDDEEGPNCQGTFSIAITE